MTRVLLVGILAAGPLLAAASPPEWLLPLLRAESLNFPASVPAEVLLNEEHLDVDANGRVVSTRRYAVRILQHAGRSAAVARAVYLTGSAKVRDFDVWVIRPQGETVKLGKESIADAALVGGDLFNEARVRVAVADEAEPGTVFAYETAVEERLFFLQYSFEFQHKLPVRHARFSLTLPSGWGATGTGLGYAAREPSISRSTYTWEIRDLPFLDSEPFMSSDMSHSPRLGINIKPTGDRDASSFAPRFMDWTEVARWHSQLTDAQVQPDDSIRAKAAALTAGAADDLAKIRAVANFVQSINYVSIQMGVARGGGYRPNPAPEILRRLYGDCKDKATLMRSLLEATGIDSYSVALYSGDPDYVLPEWASPHQFNHMIVAVRLKGSEDLAAVSKHEKLGMLLFFDPTDPLIPVGEIPEVQQGSHGLVLAASAGALVRLPEARPEANRLKRMSTIRIEPSGKLRVDIIETANGSLANRRRRYLQRSEPERRKMIERGFVSSLPGATVGSIGMSSLPSGSVETRISLDAPRLITIVPPATWLLKLGFIETLAPSLTAPKRVHPVRLRPVSTHDEFDVEVPDGYDLDEDPAPLTLEVPYGRLSLSWTRSGRKVHLNRQFELKQAVVPTAEYERLKTFLEDVHAASAAYLVLSPRR